MLGEAVRLHQEGKLEQAALLYRNVLARDANNADALHLLGMVALQQGRAQAAVDLIRQAVAIHDRQAPYHFHLALALQTLNDMEGAVASYRRARALQPDNPDIYNNMGNALAAQQRLQEALDAFRHALALQPASAVAHNNLGNVQRSLGLRGEAEASFRKAVALQPNLDAALIGLADARWDSGNLAEAEALYRRAAAARPRDTGVLNNFAALLLARGNSAAAMEAIHRSLAIEETQRAKALFVQAARRPDGLSPDEGTRHLMMRALTEPWDRPGTLGHAAARLIRSDPVIGPLVARANAAWPNRLSLAALLGETGFAPLASDALLRALLTSAPNTDIQLERFLTMLRGAMMRELGNAADAQAEHFAAALAQQCFINEYVFAADDAEMEEASAARTALETADAVTPMQLLLVASYFPLHGLANAAKLLEQSWPASVEAVITRQIHEPLEEQRLRAGIPHLTRIEDAVSRRVRDQYEESPYPRWVRQAPGTPDTIANFLAAKFPLAGFEPPHAMQDILIAGCGTGQRSIAMAQKFGDRRMLAVDLSLASLAYARRKSDALGLHITHGQADILELATLGRQFDLIESLGVLHHLADPHAGWHALLSLLRPGGVMLLGLYSGSARRPVMAARARLAAQGLGDSAGAIRTSRQDLMQDDDPLTFASILESEDFFSLSGCRDLLFHVQEHHTTLPEIGGFLEGQGLRLLGFELDDAVLAAYRSRFPQDRAAIDLRCWEAFEADHPALFGGMYVFWLQKPAARTPAD